MKNSFAMADISDVVRHRNVSYFACKAQINDVTLDYGCGYILFPVSMD